MLSGLVRTERAPLVISIHCFNYQKRWWPYLLKTQNCSTTPHIVSLSNSSDKSLVSTDRKITENKSLVEEVFWSRQIC
jgi:hypothetical protein